MPSRSVSSARTHSQLAFSACLIILGIISYFVLVRGYEKPSYFFWDENYHIASAQRYLNGVFFMEPHPPLGKLLIALGEYALDANPDDSSFVGTEKAADTPAGFSFEGYRLFPVLFGFLAHLVFFLFLLSLTSNIVISFTLSLLLILDNAQLVHFRGAMLESVQIFFVLCCLTLAINMLRGRLVSKASYALFGALFAAAMLTKINSAFLIVPALALIIWGPKQRLSFIAWSGAAFVVAFLSVWQIHFSLMRSMVDSLPGHGSFEASAPYREQIAAGRAAAPSNFTLGLEEYFNFVARYQKGVPKLNYCKKGENGSFPLLWPLGAQAINYRWEKTTQGDVSYLYLTPNPIAWGVALCGVLLSAAFICAIFFGARVGGYPLLPSAVLLFSYLIYMCAVLAASDRVFYLYHYFIPLNLSWGMFALNLSALTQIGPNLKVRQRGREIIAVGIALLTICGFIFMAPLTYYTPIGAEAVARRNILPIWNVHCEGCASSNPMARPVECNKVRTDPSWTLRIGDLTANYIEQEWGEPMQDRNDQGKELVAHGTSYDSGLGVHAYSRVQFPLASRYKNFSALAAIPDDLAEDGTSVEFKVMLDGKIAWRSGILKRGESAKPISIDLSGKEVLGLIVSDGKNGINGDHAVWLNVQLSK